MSDIGRCHHVPNGWIEESTTGDSLIPVSLPTIQRAACMKAQSHQLAAVLEL
jgi:hypothetical protein